MIVNENPRRSEHVISGSGPLAFNFGILSADDIEVIQDGTTLDPIQYQVTGVGADAGGTIILATNPNDGAQIVILGKQPYKQTSVYTTEAFPPQRLQNDFNKVVIMVQQIVEILNRTPRFARASLIDVNEIPEPAAPDLFLKTVTVNPFEVGWGTLAVLAGAVGIPLVPANGGTGGSYANTYAMLAGLGAALWGTTNVTPNGGTIVLPNPANANCINIGAGPFSVISTTGVALGTILVFDYQTGGNVITDNASLLLQGRSNYTTVQGDRSIFYYNGLGWAEIFRSPSISINNALKFLRGDGTWQTVATSVPTGVAHGLTISNNLSDPTNDIDIAAGDAGSDEANPSLRIQMFSSGIFVKQLDSDWAAGSGNGGRVIGQTLTDGTWHVFMFRRLGGAIDFCFSNSLVFVTPDSGTNRVCIMSIMRISSSIVPFSQVGDWVSWNIPAIQLDQTNPGTTAFFIPVRVPQGFSFMTRYIVQLRTTSIAVVGYFVEVSSVDNPPNLDVAPLYNVGVVNANSLTTVRQLDTMSSPTGLIRGRLHASDTGTRVRIQTIGYFHPRGRR